MRMQHPEEKIDIVGRLRNFENALVNLFIRERDAQGQFFYDEINSAQSDSELLQKSAEHEEKWLGRFNFVLKFELSSNDSGGLISLITLLDCPFARSHIRSASGPSRAPSCCLSSAAS